VTTDADFLAAIRADPRDNAVRRVYADFLSDSGDPLREARAELVRVQCDMSDLDRAGRTRSRQYRELVDRSDQLVQVHGAAWKADLPAFAQRSFFHRGFIEEVEASARSLLAGLPQLWEREPAYQIELHDAPRELARVFASPLLRDVRTLKLEAPYAARRHRGGAEALAAAVAACEYLGSLTQLYFCHVPLGDRAAAHLARATSLRALDSFILFGSSMTGEGIAALAAASWFCRLEHFTVCHPPYDGWVRPPGDGICRALAASPQTGRLVGLSLESIGTTAAGARALAASRGLRSLRRLCLDGNPLGDEGAQVLARSPLLGRLEHLSLAGTGLTAEGLRSLVGTARVRKLARLHVDGNSIRNTGAEVLAASRHLGALRLVTLCRCALSSAGIQALFDSPVLRQTDFLLFDNRMTHAVQEEYGQRMLRLVGAEEGQSDDN
jgi:uncharacterized protein (TIGR02996 family)